MVTQENFALGFVAPLAIIRVTHNYRKFEIFLAIPKYRMLLRALIDIENTPYSKHCRLTTCMVALLIA